MPRGLKNLAKQACLFARDLLAPYASFSEVSILCYHSISGGGHFTDVLPQEFEAHLAFLQAQGLVFVSLGDIELWQAGKRTLPLRAVALTFDDGYADFETAALPLLKKYQAPAALFVIGSPQATDWQVTDDAEFLADEALARLKLEPLVEIGYHSRTHPSLETLSLGDLIQEVRRPAGERYFAYPGGHYSRDVVDAIKAEGYAGAYSIKPDLVKKNSDPYLMPRSVILKGTRPWELRFATTSAVAWYRAIWRLTI